MKSRAECRAGKVNRGQIPKERHSMEYELYLMGWGSLKIQLGKFSPANLSLWY